MQGGHYVQRHQQLLPQSQQQNRVKLAPYAGFSGKAMNNNNNNQSKQNSYYVSQMKRIYSTDSVKETLWMAREKRKRNDSGTFGLKSCDNTINTCTESKYDDDEMEAAMEAYAWFNGEQKAAAEANRLRSELTKAHAEIERLRKHLDAQSANISHLQIELQRSEDHNGSSSPVTTAASTVCSDQFEEMSRIYAHNESLWLKEKKQLKEEINYLKGEIQRINEEAEQPYIDDIRTLRESLTGLREEKELLLNREESILFQTKREHAAEMEKLQLQVQAARTAAQESNVGTVEELNRLQKNHDVALSEIENLKEELKLAQEEASWLRADKVIAEEGAKVKAKISAAADLARQKELVELKEFNAQLNEELDASRQELEALKKLNRSSQTSSSEASEDAQSSSSSSSVSASSADNSASKKTTSTFAALYNLTVLLQSKGKIEEAAPHCREALVGMRNSLGENHVETLQCMNTMATLLYDLGDYDAAEPLANESYHGLKNLLGERHEYTLSAMATLAILLQALKRLDEAEPLFVEFLEQREGLLPDTHKDTLRAMNNLSLLLQSQGKCAEAEPYCRRSLECMRSTLGDLHPDTLQSISNLAMLLYGQGKLEAAEPYCYEALSGMRTALGNSHMSTLASVSNLAMMLQGQKKFESAEPYCREALAGMRSTLGNSHAITLASISNLAMLLYNREKYEESEALYQEAYDTMRNTVGENDAGTLTAMTNLAMLQQARGMLDSAEALFRECLSHRQHVLGDTHPDTIRSLNSLACLLQSQGKVNEAEDIYRESFAKVQQRAEASVAVEVERFKEQMSECSQSGQSEEGSHKSADIYANYNEEALILKGTLSSNTLNSLENEESIDGLDKSNHALTSRNYNDTSSVEENSQSILSSTSSTARLLMLKSQSPKVNKPAKMSNIQLIKCVHEKCRKRFTQMDRYISHLQNDHKDSKTVTEILLGKRKDESEKNTPDLHQKNADKHSSRSKKENVLYGCSYADCTNIFTCHVERDSHERDSHLVGDYCNASISSISSNSTGASPQPIGHFTEHRKLTDIACPDKSCGKSFMSIKDRNNHMRDAHGLVMRSEGVTPPPGLALLTPPGLVSNICEGNMNQLLYDGDFDSKEPKIYASFGRSRHTCPFSGCTKQCKTDAGLIDHIKNAHTDVVQKQKPQRSVVIPRNGKKHSKSINNK